MFHLRQENKKALITVLFCFLVAGTGIEPVSRGYEPRELPLLYPAIFIGAFLRLYNDNTNIITLQSFT